MAFSKVILNGTTLIDLTQDTAQDADVASPKTFHKADGTQGTGTASGSSKNTQVVQSTTRVTSTSLTGCSGTITVAKTGTYNIYWSTMRSSTSGTWSSQMYVGTTAYGSEQTTWSNHVQNVHLTNVSLTANQTVRVYAKSRGSNYYAYVPTFVIVEA